MPSAFFTATEAGTRAALRSGLHGWEVADCAVTMTQSGYSARQSHSHATFDKSMSSTAGDFRELAAIVTRLALAEAGTVVCEPVHRFVLELPADTLGAVLPALGRLGAAPGAPAARGAVVVLEGDVPAARVHELRGRLPSLTRGEGFLETAFDRYEPSSRGPQARR
jgi:ribosomal protection tetracycline resistance protein